MSKYTIEVRHLVEMYGVNEVRSWFTNYNLSDFLTQEEIDVIEERGTWSKEKLAKKIVEHYYMREIGFETPKLFEHYVCITMQEIMEEYAPLIYSASIAYDPLINVDYSETYHNETNDSRTDNGNTSINQTTSNTGENSISQTGTSNSSSTNEGSGLTVQSDTPQGQINKQTILSGQYATSTSANESTNTITDNSSNTSSQTQNSEETINSNQTEENETASTSNGTQDYVRRIRGNSGVSATAQAMIKQYRENIRALDSEIIERLNTLFMSIY